MDQRKSNKYKALTTCNNKQIHWKMGGRHRQNILQRTNIHEKKCSKSPMNKKIQRKTMRYFILVRTQYIRKDKTPTAGESMG